MTREELQKVFLEEIDNIAPGSVPASLDPRADIREVMDLDSMDILNLLTSLTARLKIEIPDADRTEFLTLKSAVDYLEAHAKK